MNEFIKNRLVTCKTTEGKVAFHIAKLLEDEVKQAVSYGINEFDAVIPEEFDGWMLAQTRIMLFFEWINKLGLEDELAKNTNDDEYLSTKFTLYSMLVNAKE